MNTELMSAIAWMLSRCDAEYTAVDQDGMGFNKPDTARMRWLMERYEGGYPLSSRSYHNAWRSLKKYRRQLAGFGDGYDSIPEPEFSPEKPMIATKTDTTWRDAGAKQPKLVVLNEDKSRFYVTFGYDPKIVDAIRAVQGRKWNAEHKRWEMFANEVHSYDSFLKVWQEHEFEIDPDVLDRMAEISGAHVENVEASTAVDAEIEIPTLGGTLRPFQKAGVAYALRNKRTFIGDDMGLGKTVQALATLEAANAYPAIIVCPASLKLNWKKEAGAWIPNRKVIVVMDPSSRIPYPESVDVLIVNYDILTKHGTKVEKDGRKKTVTFITAVQQMRDRVLKAVIFDESHYAKNYKAKRTVACEVLARDTEYRLLLTGTPVLNRPQELISQLTILDRLNALGGFKKFAYRYCGAYEGRFGLDMSGATNLPELSEKLRGNCMVRRLKGEVLKELPPKQRTTVPVEITNRAEYERAADDVAGWLKEEAIKAGESAEEANEKANSALLAEQLVRIEKLKQLAAKGKMEAAFDWIDSFLETDEKLVIFGTHYDVIEAVAERYKCPVITGETKIEDRDKAVRAFQEDAKTRLLVANIKAGGVGLTLTAASNVLFLELGWTPAEMEQAEDRTHRIGQTDQVTAWYMVGESTIDVDMMELLEKKREVVTGVTEGLDVKSVSILKELVARLEKRAG